MSDDKVRRVTVSIHEVEEQRFTGGLGSEAMVKREMIRDDERGHFAIMPWDIWELSKSHFIEMDKKLAQLQTALGEEQRKNRMPYSKTRIEP